MYLRHTRTTATTPHALLRAATTGAVATLLVAHTLLLPASAFAAYLWSEGGTKKFGGSVDSNLAKVKTGTKHSIRLDSVYVGQFTTGSSFSPSSAQRLENGNTLVAYPDGVIVEHRPNGNSVPPSIATGPDGTNFEPVFAQRINKNDTLIADRASSTVFVWDKTREGGLGGVEWSYAGSLVDPVYAVRLADGSTLICDAGGGKVIKVKGSSDFPKWTIGGDILGEPRSVQSLGNGNVLIADAGKHRVVEMNPTTDEAVWSYGKAGVSGSATDRLNNPTFAQRQSDGSTMIVDSGNRRVLRISKGGAVERINAASLGLNGLSPSTAMVTPSGTTLVIDTVNHRLVEYGRAKRGRYTSGRLDFGNSTKKRITKIEAVSTRPSDTAVKIQYSANGGKWKSVSGPVVTFPTGLDATYVRVRADLSTSDRSITPVLESLQVTYSAIPTVGSSGSSNWSQLYGQSFTPYNPGSATAGGAGSGSVAAGAKTAGAAGALQPGSSVPGVASATLYTGFLMQRVTNGAQVTKDPRGLPGLPIDPAGTAAALLFVSAVYSVGLASTTLSRVGQAAFESLKSVLLRSMNG